MSTLIVALTAVATLGAPIPGREVKLQNETFEELWQTDFVWKFDDLPAKGGVEQFRVPYSGYIYPDRAGGTRTVLRKYDQAFSRGRSLAASHEAWDTTAFKEPARGIFGGRALFGRMAVPDWYGHCNGWTSAAIRHAEPQRSVTVKGVTFSPADIKALLAEIYIYNDHTVLTGDNQTPVNAGAFHAIISNWLGRGEHPLGMEEDPTKEKWNYPIYAYATSSAKHSDRRVEVKMNVAYALDSDGEYNESPRIKEIKYFHYMLELNARGEIYGGYFLRDSAIIDMLWLPLVPKKSGQAGNEAGNPYVNVNQVLAIWRASVPQELRDKWVTVDAAEQDRVAFALKGNEITTPVSENVPPVVSDSVDTESSAASRRNTEPELRRDTASTASQPVVGSDEDDPAPAPLANTVDDMDYPDVAADVDFGSDGNGRLEDEGVDGFIEAADPLPLEAFID